MSVADLRNRSAWIMHPIILIEAVLFEAFSRNGTRRNFSKTQSRAILQGLNQWLKIKSGDKNSFA